MADILTLLPDTAPILREKLDLIDVEALGGSLKELSERLHATRHASQAIGLAANQVGIKARMFVMGDGVNSFTCINPEVIESNDTLATDKEGCLSFPGLWLKVKRPTEIKVKYIDENLDTKEHTFKGKLARCFLHELDHLNGVVFTDHVSKLTLEMARKKKIKRTKRV